MADRGLPVRFGWFLEPVGDTGEVLGANKPDLRWAPASTTKMMSTFRRVPEKAAHASPGLIASGRFSASRTWPVSAAASAWGAPRSGWSRRGPRCRA